jgi:hypothetical protein
VKSAPKGGATERRPLLLVLVFGQYGEAIVTTNSKINNLTLT